MLAAAGAESEREDDAAANHAPTLARNENRRPLTIPRFCALNSRIENSLRFFLRFACASRNRSAQPSTLTCFTRVSASAPRGTSFVTVVPEPTYAPRPTVTGATSWLSEPMNAPSSIVVLCLLTPS